MIRVLLVALVCILGLGAIVASCTPQRPVVSRISDNNQDYKVDYLFEHEGCKVYRFRDEGRYVYFTNCTGDVTSIKSDSTKQRVEMRVRRY